MQLVEGLTVAERFRLVRELGRGGMGSVWLAEHTALDVLCAVKFIDRERNTPEMRARFEQEAKAAAQLRSPYVVQILDHGIWKDLPYIAMEYLHGEDLAQRLERELLLPPFEAFRILSQVGRALSKAHAAGIVHRDLKPENIFLVRDDDEEVAKVLDFGIAKRSATSVVDSSSTRPGSLLGTPFYMSPEQARGNRAVDHRSDLWSLAVITYQCLTGHLPFSSEGLGDVLSQIMHDPLPVPSQVYAGVPPGFDQFWAKAASRNPDERYQSAKEFCEALSEALELFESIVLTDVTSRISSPSAAFDGAGSSEPAGASIHTTTTDTPVYNTFAREPKAKKGRRMLLAAALAVCGAGALGWFASGPSAPAANGTVGVAGVPRPPERERAEPPVQEPPVTEDPPVKEPERAEQPESPASAARPPSVPRVAKPAATAKPPAPATNRARPKKGTKPTKKRVDFGI